MTNYKEKHCSMCDCVFIPTSPKQLYCVECRPKAKRLRDKKYDCNRSRINNNYIEYTRYCLSCGKEFKTYYSKKKYCGSDMCEKERVRIKNYNFNLRRDKYTENIRKTEYYNKTKSIRLLQKALKYRELTGTEKIYARRAYKRSYSFVKEYISKYGYKLLTTKSEYKNTHSKIKLLCPEGHEWETTFHGFRDIGDNQGNRCLYCYLDNNYTSQPEQKVLDYFNNNYPTLNVIHNDRSQISPLELDLYFPDHGVGIEVCGLYWHSEVSGGKSKQYHYDKMVRCYECGIRLITVFEDEIRDKFDIVISRILSALNIIPRRIYARKCDLKEISVGESNLFFKENHIQGESVAKKSWGLFYEDKLVAAASVGATGRKHAGNETTIELKRFCSKLSVSVVGGFSKLFKEIVSYCRSNNFKTIKSYCDMRYGNISKPVYESAGFKLDRFTKYTPHYIKKGQRYRNISLRKTVAERSTGFTEWELRRSQGYDRIWDCGHRTYIYNL